MNSMIKYWTTTQETELQDSKHHSRLLLEYVTLQRQGGDREKNKFNDGVFLKCISMLLHIVISHDESGDKKLKYEIPRERCASAIYRAEGYRTDSETQYKVK